jgi:ATP-binding protein involved in chromosome partitioning
MQSIPLSGGVIVTLPQQVSLEDASRGLEMFKVLNVPVLGVVENMSYLELPDGTKMDIFGSGGGQQLAQTAGVPFMGTIPIDPTVRIGGDQGIPITVSHPDSASARALRNVAERIAAELSVAAFNQASNIAINVIE